MSNTHRWLEIAEYVFLAASVVGAVVAVVYEQVIYAVLPVCVSLLLNLMNRRRFEQQHRRRTSAAINRLSADIQSLQQQIVDTRNAASLKVKEAIATLQVDMSRRGSSDSALDLLPLYENLAVQKRFISSLQEQCTTWEESLNNIINYLNSSSLPPRVEHLEKASAQLSQEITRIASQVEQIDAQFQSIQEVSPHQDYPQHRVVAESVSPASIPETTLVDEYVLDTEDFAQLQNQTWVCVDTLFGHDDWVRSLAFSPNQQSLVSGSFDKTIKVWHLPSGEVIHTLSEHTKGVFSVAISPDGQTIASGSWDETIKLWQSETGKLISTLTNHAGSVRSIIISPDGQRLVSGSFDKTIKLWRLDTGELIDTLSEYSSPVYAIALGSDARILASGGDDGIVTLWQFDSGKRLGFLTGNLSCVCSLAISPNAQLLAACSANGVITVWHLGTGKVTGVVKAHSGQVTSGVFSPDGQTFISGSAEGAIKVWYVETNGQLQQSPLQAISDDGASSVISIAISPDGKMLASGCADGSIKLWQPN